MRKIFLLKNITVTQIIFFLMLLFMTMFLLFYRLGNNYLTNWDEAWFASVAKDMAERNDFLNGRWNGSVWFYEPPLLTWVLSIVFKFTQSHFWLRFFNAFCSTITVLATFFLAKLLTKNHVAGFFSALILVSNIEFLFRSRQINTEGPLTLFLTLSVLALLVAYLSKKSYWLLIMFGFLGVSLITKRATTFLAFPALIYLLFIMSRNKNIKSKDFLYGLLILSLVVFPWYILNFLEWGKAFWQDFFVGSTFGRVFLSNEVIGTSPFFYIKSLIHSFKIFFLIIPFAFGWLMIKGTKDKIYRFILIYLITFFLVLTLIPLKASWYLLPSYPVFAVVTGVFLWKVSKLFDKIKYVFIPLIILVSLLQIYHWRDNFIVPDTTENQAKIAIAAKQLTKDGDTLYLDDFWFPVAVYYSNRKVTPLRFNRSTGIETNIPIPSDAIVITNEQSFGVLQQNTQKNYEIINRNADLILVRTN